MINAKQSFINMVSSPVRLVKARAELYNGSTLVNTFSYTDRLKSFTVERVGEGKFFGFGICQKINVKLIDTNKELNITTANTFKIAYGVDEDYIYPHPLFRVTEVHRDEKTNELSVTAYDAIYNAVSGTFADLNLVPPYTIKKVVQACCDWLGLFYSESNIKEFMIEYPDGANFNPSDTIRAVLDDVAEVTQTIYYVDTSKKLIFKRLDKDGKPVLNITREDYFSLDSHNNRRLSKICSATELGDNVSAELSVTGSTQYIRDNGFWELMPDINELVQNALAVVGGITIGQFSCSWRGNFLLELGDKIQLLTRDSKTVTSYLLDDVITYNGFLSEKTQWEYAEEEEGTADNPASLGATLNKTFAKVDKINKRIDLVVNDVTSGLESTREDIANLKVESNRINASVSDIEKNTNTALNGIGNDINTLTKKVDATMSSEQVKIEIQKQIDKGVNKVETNTGFTFNEKGLTVSKSGSQMKTEITEDGMKVYRDSQAVLTANNVGVDATNLTANTYLIVGGSRFEKYGYDRTGCFWIGN